MGGPECNNTGLLMEENVCLWQLEEAVFLAIRDGKATLFEYLGLMCELLGIELSTEIQPITPLDKKTAIHMLHLESQVVMFIGLDPNIGLGCEQRNPVRFKLYAMRLKHFLMDRGVSIDPVPEKVFLKSLHKK